MNHIVEIDRLMVLTAAAVESCKRIVEEMSPNPVDDVAYLLQILKTAHRNGSIEFAPDGTFRGVCTDMKWISWFEWVESKIEDS